MRRVTVVYGVALALGAFVLQWLEHQFALQLFSTEIYIALIAGLFTGLGIWVGLRLNQTPNDQEFQRNEQVISTLGLTPKELEVLKLLADGGSNREIANRLFVSPSTIKTHIVHLFQKLEVSRRTQAVHKARNLQIIP